MQLRSCLNKWILEDMSRELLSLAQHVRIPHVAQHVVCSELSLICARDALSALVVVKLLKTGQNWKVRTYAKGIETERAALPAGRG